eukprot:4175007-Amphidinium_carterae.1
MFVRTKLLLQHPTPEGTELPSLGCGDARTWSKLDRERLSHVRSGTARDSKSACRAVQLGQKARLTALGYGADVGGSDFARLSSSLFCAFRGNHISHNRILCGTSGV